MGIHDDSDLWCGRTKLRTPVDFGDFIETGHASFTVDTPSPVDSLDDELWLDPLTGDVDAGFELENDQSSLDRFGYVNGVEAEAPKEYSNPHNKEREHLLNPRIEKPALLHFLNVVKMKGTDKARREREKTNQNNIHSKVNASMASNMMPITDDKELLKKIIHPGNGTTLPAGQVRVLVKYTIYKESDLLRTNTTAIDSVFSDVPFAFTLRKHNTLPALELGVATMELKEKAEFLASPNYAYGPLGVPGVCDPDTNCVFIVELIKFLYTSLPSELNESDQGERTFRQVIECATQLKDTGNAQHEAKNYEKCLHNYSKAVRLLEEHVTCVKADDEDRNALLFTVYSNIAQTHLNMDDGKRALADCTKAAQLPPGTKGNKCKLAFRQSKAYMICNKLDQSRDAALTALKLQPGNIAIVQWYKMVATKVAQEEERSQRIYKKMGELYFCK